MKRLLQVAVIVAMLCLAAYSVYAMSFFAFVADTSTVQMRVDQALHFLRMWEAIFGVSVLVCILAGIRLRAGNAREKGKSDNPLWTDENEGQVGGGTST
jgi:hypothetical protein